MTLTLDQEALMLRILDAEEAGKTYVLDSGGRRMTREYVTVKSLLALDLATRVWRSIDVVGMKTRTPMVRSTCQGCWLHDSLNIRVRLRAAGLSTRSCPLRTV